MRPPQDGELQWGNALRANQSTCNRGPPLPGYQGWEVLFKPIRSRLKIPGAPQARAKTRGPGLQSRRTATQMI